MKKKVDDYFTFVRPKLAEAGNDISNLFIMPGSLPVTRIGNLTRFLEKELHLTIPTCTMARKIGATSAAHHLDDSANLLISNQMSWSQKNITKA